MSVELRKDLTAQRFFRLLVLNHVPCTSPRTFYLCRCDCGTERKFRSDALTSGRANSCGCWNDEVRVRNGRNNRTHGMTHTGIYNSWRAMIARCLNPNSDKFKWYGARGIKVCRRWRTFKNFHTDLGPKWFPGATIERLDVNGNYSLENCTWLTMSDQQKNKRKRA